MTVKTPSGKLEGFLDQDKKAYARFLSRIKKLEPGELCIFDVTIPRNYKFLKKFFALLTVGFENWECSRKHRTYKGRPVTKDFERFRSDITILAGYFTQTYDIDGKMKIEAESISFANMDEIKFERVYSDVLNVLLDKVLTTYKNRAEVDAVVEKMMNFL